MNQHRYASIRGIRLGHRDPMVIKKLNSNGLATGVNMIDCGTKQFCDSCLRGKMTRIPFPQVSNSRTQATLDLVHSDICGPMQTVTPSGNKYMLTFTDDYSRYTVIYLMAKKSDLLEKFKEYVKMVETQYHKKPKILRSDRGGEYMGFNFKAYLKEKGIMHQPTAPYTPQQNGVAERKNRTLMEATRCMLIDSKLDKRFWGEAVRTANYLQNRLPTNITSKSPYELWFNKVPNLAHIRIFGSMAYAAIPKEKRQKLDDKAKCLIFVGYDDGSKAYRLLDTSTNLIQVSRDVRFIEQDHKDMAISKNCEDGKSGFAEEQIEIEDLFPASNTQESVESVNDEVPTRQSQ